MTLASVMKGLNFFARGPTDTTVFVKRQEKGAYSTFWLGQRCVRCGTRVWCVLMMSKARRHVRRVSIMGKGCRRKGAQFSRLIFHTSNAQKNAHKKR